MFEIIYLEDNMLYKDRIEAKTMNEALLISQEKYSEVVKIEKILDDIYFLGN